MAHIEGRQQQENWTFNPSLSLTQVVVSCSVIPHSGVTIFQIVDADEGANE